MKETQKLSIVEDPSLRARLIRLSWKPVVPGLGLLTLLAKHAAGFTLMGYIALGVVTLWFVLSIYNEISDGKLLAFLYEEDGTDGTPKAE